MNQKNMRGLQYCKPLYGSNGVLEWLLENEMPEVKYRTMIELLDMPKNTLETNKAKDALLDTDIVSIFQCTNRDYLYVIVSRISHFTTGNYD